MTARTRRWTVPRDVGGHVRRAWDRGTPLAAVASGDPMPPIRVPVTGPTGHDRGADYTATRDWITAWRHPGPGIRVDWVTVTDKTLGRVTVPRTAWIDTPADAATIIGVTGDLDTFTGLVAGTPPPYRTWMAAHPHQVLTIGPDWPAVVAAAAWISAHPMPGIYLRELPVPGVHTKLVQRYPRDIDALITHTHAPADTPEPDTLEPGTPDTTGGGAGRAWDRISAADATVLEDPDVPPGMSGTPDRGHHRPASGRTWFETKYGFATKPLRVRLRILDPTIPGAIPGLTDVEVPTRAAADNPLTPTTVLIVENEITFLALPPLPGTVAVYGAGNTAPAVVTAIPWLTAPPTTVVYWGDIDTHGYAILSRVRAAAHGPVNSILMNTDTFLTHQAMWTSEDATTGSDLPHLTDAEHAVYDGLRRGTWGTGIRLEQERIPWPTVTATLTTVTGR